MEMCDGLGGGLGRSARADRRHVVADLNRVWEYITPDNMPVEGEQVFTKYGEIVTATEDSEYSIWENCADGTFLLVQRIEGAGI
jgi:hypothetical protein